MRQAFYRQPGIRCAVEGRLNINVSAVDYQKTQAALSAVLSLLEKRIHAEDAFSTTDSEFAFGWHFFVLSVRRDLVWGLAEQMGPDFERLKGKGIEDKFISWLHKQASAGSPRFKMDIKERMESSKFGIF